MTQSDGVLFSDGSDAGVANCLPVTLALSAARKIGCCYAIGCC